MDLDTDFIKETENMKNNNNQENDENKFSNIKKNDIKFEKDNETFNKKDTNKSKYVILEYDEEGNIVEDIEKVDDTENENSKIHIIKKFHRKQKIKKQNSYRNNRRSNDVFDISIKSLGRCKSSDNNLLNTFSEIAEKNNSSDSFINNSLGNFIWGENSSK